MRLYAIAGMTIVMLMLTIGLQYQINQVDKWKTAAEQSSSQLKLCVKDYTKNQEIVDEYQETVNTLSGRVDALKLRYRSECTKVPVSTNGGHKTADGGYVQENGVPIGELLDYAAQCERLRLQLGAAQRYINE